MTQVNSNTTTLFVSTRRAIQPHVRALIESHSGGTFGPGGFVGLECRRDAVHELVRRLKAQPKRRHQRPPDGLRTASEAAAKLGCSVKTLKGHVAAGALNYVIIGHGRKRPRKMFTDADLDAFIEAQTRKDVAVSVFRKPRSPYWRFDFQIEVIAFSAVNQGHDPAGSGKSRNRRAREGQGGRGRQKAAKTSLRLDDVAGRWWLQAQHQPAPQHLEAAFAAHRIFWQG